MAVPAPSATLKARAGRPYTLIGIVLAVLGFGVVLLFGLMTGGRGGGGGASVVQTDVVVAARDISLRTPIAAGDVVVARYASTNVPQASFAKPDDVKNLVALVDIKKGQPITANLLVKDPDAVIGPQSAFLPIPSGFVALTIPTSEQTGVAGYIQAGDYISVIAIVPSPKGQNVRTIYTNVHVLKVGPAVTDKSAGAPKTTGGLSSSLTVIVTACQAEDINWFLANASMRYILEADKDYKPQDTAPDQSCPSVTAAGGVRQSDVANRWPGIFAP